jgi:hypothetical protein
VFGSVTADHYFDDQFSRKRLAKRSTTREVNGLERLIQIFLLLV